MKRELPLGMNARNFLYIIPYNKPSAKRRADDKLKTKLTLVKNGISTPGLLAQFASATDIEHFDWESLPKSFVLKPARGYAGGGYAWLNHGTDNKEKPKAAT